jgi:hypothetical protein
MCTREVGTARIDLGVQLAQNMKGAAPHARATPLPIFAVAVAVALVAVTFGIGVVAEVVV